MAKPCAMPITIPWGEIMNGKNVDVNYDLLGADIVKRAEKIALILMDVDGVMTDGTLYYLPGANGEAVEFKGFNSHDGLGLHFCHAAGIKTGVISGRDSFATTERARMLKMTYVYQGHLKKVPSFEEILADAQLPNDAVAFIVTISLTCHSSIVLVLRVPLQMPGRK